MIPVLAIIGIIERILQNIFLIFVDEIDAQGEVFEQLVLDTNQKLIVIRRFGLLDRGASWRTQGPCPGNQPDT
jgi:hypothetical protein